MPKILRFSTVFALIMMIAASILYHGFNKKIYLTAAITFGTVFYHLGIRLLIGFLYHVGMKNQADYTKGWYQVRPWENRIYEWLRVKSWKDKMPTYDPQAFSLTKHTWNEIAQAMCQAELVHETNMVFSFIPIVAAKWFGAFSVFLITSMCSAFFDLLFVIVQRYNRARVVKLALKRSAAIRAGKSHNKTA